MKEPYTLKVDRRGSDPVRRVIKSVIALLAGRVHE